MSAREGKRARAYAYGGGVAVALLGALTPPMLLGGFELARGGAITKAMMADTLLSNLWVVGLAVLSVAGSARLGRWAGAAARLPAAAAVALYAADAAVGLLFGVRLFLRDAVAFAGDPADWVRFLSVGATTGAPRLVVAGTVGLGGLLCAAGLVLCGPPRPSRCLVAAAAGADGAGASPRTTTVMPGRTLMIPSEITRSPDSRPLSTM